jgi:predicted aldo/keto reductase-like oxidoreductase
MVYKKFQNIIDISRLGMGIMRLPIKENEPGTPIDKVKAQVLIDYAISHGINYYDTAYIYHNGESESFLGEALSKYPRDSYYIADKFNMLANPDYKAQFAEQLSRLQTDYIDFYLLHGIQDHTMDACLSSGCVEYFEELKKSGKIRYFGFSFHGSPKILERMMEERSWDFVQIQLNYYDWAYNDAKELYEILEKYDVPVMVMEPVHGGRLASLTPEANVMLLMAEPEKSIASWAMRWVMSLPNVMVTLSGMSNEEQVKDNIKTFEENKPLTEEQKELLMKACDLYRPSVSVACTGCRYCCSDCPKELDIPRLLTIYNEVKMDGPWRLSFLGILPEEKTHSACIGCNSCQKHCPQSFDIPVYMKEMSDLTEQMKR